MIEALEESRITGMMIYYYFVCKKKLWYFTHEIAMEQNDSNVAIGKVLDETSYAREDKHINIDGVINIDFVAETGVLHEIKKSKKVEEASIWQVKYYLYYLEKKGINDIYGKIDYPLLKKNITVELFDEDKVRLEEIIKQIEEIKKKDYYNERTKKRICKSCAYHDLCFI